MTADVATPKSKLSPAAPSAAAASADGRTDGPATPFYDHLMSMIDATAEENDRVAWSDGAGAAQAGAGHGWRVSYPVAGAAGFLLALAVGGVVLASQLGRREPPLVAAAEAPEARPRAIGIATAADALVQNLAPAAAVSDGREPAGGEEPQTGDREIITGSVAAGGSDDLPTATAMTGRRVESSGREAPAGALPNALPNARAPAAGEADPGSRAGEPALQPARPADATWSLTLAPASESQSNADRPGPSPEGETARIVSGVNMRAGPSNGQAVVATIPRGSVVQVIECRQWCEVIFAGQHGWVYKSFLGPAAATAGAR